MSADARISHREQSVLDAASSGVDGHATKHPVSQANRMKVPPFNPASRFVGVSPARPSPQLQPEPMVHAAEYILADHVPVVVRPSPDDRIQGTDNHRLWRGSQTREDVADLRAERFLALTRRLDQQFTVRVFANILTEKIKPILNLRDPCL